MPSEVNKDYNISAVHVVEFTYYFGRTTLLLAHYINYNCHGKVTHFSFGKKKIGNKFVTLFRLTDSVMKITVSKNMSTNANN